MISAIGSQMQLWAIYWHLRTLSDQPLVISGIGLARFLPVMILSLFAGVVADHFNRRKVTILTQTILILVALALGILTYLNITQLWTIYIMVIIQSVAVSFDLPARQSLIPSLVPREDLPSAYSMNSISSNVGSILGPAICGLVIAYLGLQWAYWINAISYIAVIAALVAMGPVQKSDQAHPVAIQSYHDRHQGRDPVHSQLPHHPVIHDSRFCGFILLFRQYPVAFRGA